MKFTSLNTKNGLSSNTINVILQDHTGFMWFGTADGLNKYDGTNVTVYSHNEQDSTSLPSNEILSLMEDKTGRLWVGTAGGGLVYYDAKHDCFLKYYTGNSAKVEKGLIRGLYQDQSGNIWVGSYGGFRIIGLKSRQTAIFDLNALLPKNITNLVVLSFLEIDQQHMWIGTNRGLLLFSRANKTFTIFVHDATDPASISGDNVRTITKDNKGCFFFGTDNGLNVLMPDKKSFKVFRHNDKRTNSISSDVIYTTVAAADGKIWLGTENGLSILDSAKDTSFNIRPDQHKSFGLSHKSIRSIFIDNRGIVWIGTYQGGVNKYDPNLPLFNLKRCTPFDPIGLLSASITSFAEYHQYIYIGTDGDGLQSFDRRTGLLNQFIIHSKLDHSVRSLSILAMDITPDKKICIGTYLDGLFIFDPATLNYKQFTAGPSDHDLNQNDIFFVKSDSKGLIWIGTNGHGVNVFDPKTQVFSNFRNVTKTAPQFSMLANGFMRAIAEDRAGNIWIGSAGAGIIKYNRKQEAFTVINQANSKLSNNVVLSIFCDNSDNVWIGTNGNGIDILNQKTNRFTHINEANGLPNSTIYKILSDRASQIWVTTEKGISSIDYKTKKIKNFGPPNGVQDSPFALGAGIMASTGELFFGGQDGFNYFLPSSLPIDNHMPPVILTELKVSNQVATHRNGSPINQQITDLKEIKLSYGQNFAISYIALDYTAAQQIRYAYRLKGLDQEWNNVGMEKTAYYTNLDPGDYVFEVRSSNNEGIWNNKVTSVQIHVLPPFWRTSYAYIIYSALAIGLLFYIRSRGIIRIKNQIALEQEKINAQQLIEQQRKEAEHIHETDMQKIKFLTNLSHEFRTPISLIIAPSDKLLSVTKEPAILNHVKTIRRNARRLLNLVNQLLDFRKMEEHELKLNASSGNLVDFVREAVESFRDLSDRKKIKMTITSEIESLPAMFDHDKIERIIFNLLSNAFKFTEEGGEVNIKMTLLPVEEAKPSFFQIIIADNGIGIPYEVQDQIFERFYTGIGNTAILNQGSGIGLSIVKEFIQLHGGDIIIESEPGLGTTFQLSLLVTEPASLETQSTTKTELSEENMPGFGGTTEQTTITSEIKNIKVLLVEDNEEYRFYLKDSLKSFYQVIEAENGKEGWQKALASHPHLIVSDVSMPYMTGIELSLKIKNDKRTCQIPVILLTASNGEEDQIKGLASGANDYLTKPFNFNILNKKISNLLHYSQSLREVYSKHIEVKNQDVVVKSNDEKLLSSIVKYIDEKMNDPEMSVEELSKHVGMSRGSLYHKLLELTGMTPIEYIRSIKLNRAAKFLEKSDYNVAQIAYMTGFGTPSYFSRLFKTTYGVLPSEFIESKRKNGKSKIEIS